MMESALRSTGSLMGVGRKQAAEVYPFLEAYIAKKEAQIAEITEVVERYEKKRMMEERAYQQMSPLRRMFTGKKPDHHLAVEYIHYVRKPMEQIKHLRAEMEAAIAILKGSKPQDLVELSPDMEREMV